MGPANRVELSSLTYLSYSSASEDVVKQTRLAKSWSILLPTPTCAPQKRKRYGSSSIVFPLISSHPPSLVLSKIRTHHSSTQNLVFSQKQETETKIKYFYFQGTEKRGRTPFQLPLRRQDRYHMRQMNPTHNSIIVFLNFFQVLLIKLIKRLRLIFLTWSSFHAA